jgi:uncharacterized membrane protein YphA (DoxX/SURF4 family)
MPVKKLLDNRWFVLTCRLVLGAVFIYASIDKIQHPAAFAKQVYNYQMLPVTASNLFAIALPWMELFAGLALIMGVFRGQAALLLSTLLVIFIVAISVNLARGVDLDCGCFSTSGEGRSIGLLTVAEDFALLGAGLVILYGERRRSEASSPLSAPAS